MPAQRGKHYSVQIDPSLLAPKLAAYDFIDHLLAMTFRQVEQSHKQAALAL